jgi:peptidoglycan hydrolase-like protein with peptidoglycan-binding domain
MATTNNSRIDALWAGTGSPTPISAGDTDAEAVGIIQDLLVGHGTRGLPPIDDPNRGTFGPRTTAAIKAFQANHDLPITGTVDHDTLHRLAEEPASTPVAGHGYVTLKLERPWSGFTRLVALTAQFEAAGKFAVLNRNTDRAGLSFGIIQWAQKPLRLNGLLRAFRDAAPQHFVDVFGGGNPAVASGLVAHTAKPSGGVDPKTGQTLDPAFDLVTTVWAERFETAGRDPMWQRVQLQEAISAFRSSRDRIRAVAPLATSERAIAFLLDVANQHGDGGLSNICKSVTGTDEASFLLAVQNESVRRVRAQFGENSNEARGTLNRRQRFRVTTVLAESPFHDA